MSGFASEATGLMDGHVDDSRVRADDFDEVRDRQPGRRQKERGPRPRTDQAETSVSSDFDKLFIFLRSCVFVFLIIV